MKKLVDSERIKILVCCHKKCDLPKDDIFLPIQVGAALTDVDLGIQRDDDGENISAKNKSYCELTAMYWAWKNIEKKYPDIEYIGLNHYRRYFNFEKSFTVNDTFVLPENNATNYSINKKKLCKYIKKGYLIVSKQRILSYSLFMDYCCGHISDDIRTLQKIIFEITPEYKDSFNRTIYNNNKMSGYNMFIMKYSDFKNYCIWLFSILSEAENKIDISSYNDVQKRIFGYMAERLFNVWLYKNNLKTIQLPIYWYANTKISSTFTRIKINIKNTLSFFFIRSH
jgi:hypothetical protein